MATNIIVGLIGVALAALAILPVETSFRLSNLRSRQGRNPWPWIGLVIAASLVVAVNVAGSDFALPLWSALGGAATMTLFVYLGRVLREQRVKPFNERLYDEWVDRGTNLQDKKKRLNELRTAGAIDDDACSTRARRLDFEESGPPINQALLWRLVTTAPKQEQHNILDELKRVGLIDDDTYEHLCRLL